MSNFSEDIIRTTLLGVANTLGVRIDIPDETIADLAATLQTDIDRIEAVETESFEFLNELALAFRSGEKYARYQHTPILEGIRAVLALLAITGRLIPAGGMALTAEQVEDVEALVATANPYSAPAVRLRALFPATEPAEDAKPCGSNSVTLGWCKLTARHEGLHTNGTYLWGTPSEPDPPAPAEPAEEETKAEGPCEVRSPQGDTCSFPKPGHAGVHTWAWPDKKPASSPIVPAPTETGPWQDWPSLDAIPADVRTVWDKAGDEYRRTNGGWKFRSHGGKWQQITLPLDDYIDYAPFTTAAVAVWDPELGTRNDWTLNEGAEQ